MGKVRRYGVMGEIMRIIRNLCIWLEYGFFGRDLT